MDTTLEHQVKTLEAAWGVQPVCTLACAGYADQHWQIWHPEDRDGGMPAYVVLPDGTVHPHPDSTR